MISSLSEWHAARALLDKEAQALNLPVIPAGIMIEVPAASLCAPAFADEVDFFSIGTNDLTQYTLAMDRGHPKLAPFIDGLHPAVLHLMSLTTRAARVLHRPVSVCGGLAADRTAVPILLGLGVSKLSVPAPLVPGVKAEVRRWSLPACRDLAETALLLSSPDEVRDLVRRARDEKEA